MEKGGKTIERSLMRPNAIGDSQCNKPKCPVCPSGGTMCHKHNICYKYKCNVREEAPVLRKRSALSALGLQCILFWKYSLHMVCIQANMSAFWDFLDILRSYILYFPYFLVLCYFTCLSSSDYDRTCNMYL